MVKITEETMKSRIRNFLPSRNLTEALSEAIDKAEKTNTLEGYKDLARKMESALQKDVLSAVARGEDVWDALHLYLWNLDRKIEKLEDFIRIENNLVYRKEIKGELRKETSDLLSSINDLYGRALPFEVQLSELETIFNQQLKTQKNNWNAQIKEKNIIITNLLHSGKGNTGPVREEIGELQKKLENYKKIVQQLKEARNILKEDSVKELAELKNYLTNSLQELQKEDIKEVYRGAYQVIEEIKERQEKTKQVFKTIENIVENEKIKLEENFSAVQKLIQELLKDQQQVQIHLPFKGSNN